MIDTIHKKNLRSIAIEIQADLQLSPSASLQPKDKRCRCLVTTISRVAIPGRQDSFRLVFHRYGGITVQFH
jgi:hypothetical protein